MRKKERKENKDCRQDWLQNPSVSAAVAIKGRARLERWLSGLTDWLMQLLGKQRGGDGMVRKTARQEFCFLW